MSRCFTEDVLRLAGEEVRGCIQCGTCSASCPTAHLMRPSIRLLIKHCLEGRKEEALRNETLWLCTSCLLCTVRCPRGIRPKSVVAALKFLAEREGIDGGDLAYEEIFLHQIEENGRISEVPLSGEFVLVFPQGIFQSIEIGLELAQRGKVALSSERIRGVDEVRRIVEELSRGEG